MQPQNRAKFLERQMDVTKSVISYWQTMAMCGTLNLKDKFDLPYTDLEKKEYCISKMLDQIHILEKQLKLYEEYL